MSLGNSVMSGLLSKQVRLTLEKQEAAQALRRQAREAKAQRLAEDQKALSDRLAALQRYQTPRLQTIEQEFLSELEKKQKRGPRKQKESKAKSRWKESRGSIETTSRLVESRLAMDSITEDEELMGKTALQDESQLTSTSQESPDSVMFFGMREAGKLDNSDVGNKETISEINSEEAEDCEEKSAQPRPEDLQSRYTPEPKPHMKRYYKVSHRGRLPPPTIPYLSRGGDLLSVHIVGHGERKTSMDLHRRQSESPIGRASSRVTSKGVLPPLLDDRWPARKASNSTSRDPTPSPRAQFHIFRDIPMDDVHKVDAEKTVVQSRMRQYAVRTKMEFMPVPSERKRIELHLMREKHHPTHRPRPFNRIGLHALAKLTLL